MEGNDCTTVVHPVSDSHYDTILEDEIHIPIDPVENVPKERHYLGKMDVICPSCSAYHWLDERLTKSTKKKSFFGMCCLQGKIKLPLLTPLPSAIKLLYEGRNSLARSFRKDIRSYNAANAFSSLGVSMDKRILKGRGPTSFTIHANSNGGESIPIRLAYTPTTDPRRYNLPTSEDIAVIIPGDETEPTSKRDIILHLKNNNLERISECHPLYLPSHYVLLFPTGDLGWSTDMKHWDVKNEWYFTVTDIVTNGHNPNDIGKKFILPSTHLGSPRHMYEIYQDSMAITRYYKHPDIFMMVTANPKWSEIQNELKPGQAALDRPDLVARVFELKRKAIMHEIKNRGLFGRVVAKVTTDQVDRIVCAEFPDPIKHPALFETIKKCMVHGPCGTRNMESVCMENKVCRSRYPRENVNDTRIDVDGYPIYRRRKTGKSYHVRGHLVDNKDVVPYNPHLSEMFDCHINVEICASVRAVKYINKYIYKGHDRTTMVVGAEDDEIQQYLDARYIGPTEAAWRLYGFQIHEELPCVTRLALHLKGMHVCVFNPNDTPEQVKEKAENQKSSLTAYFDWYEKNPTTKAYTYQQFSEHFRWLLLTVVKGPPSFESLYSVDGIKHKTYREACIARGLLEDDNEWDKCLEEAVIMKTDTLRSEGHIVIMVASSGIASLLLTGGRTAHSTFKIPFEVLDDSVCSVTKQTIHAELFKRAKLIIWDEVPMQHRFCVEAVDRTLRDIREINEPFGGITVVLGGDFKQTLPVITKGTRQEIVRACLTKSHLWSGVRLLTLVKNMRLNSNDTENVKFADYLIEIGTNPKEDVELPSEIKRCKSTMDLLFKVYPNLNVEEVATETYLQERSILSARNDDVATLNELAINYFPGELHEYLAADKAIEDDQPIENRGNSISNENMQALDPPSLPPFKLQLKVGCPIMLLRNFQPRDGLCNGTRLMVVQFATRVIEAKIVNGSHAGNYVFIPRITLQPSVSETPFQMARRQFPVRLAFAMTINKSQGQSVKYVGIDLRNHVFSHGQLYVALSRCTSSNRISVLLGNEDNDKTTNVVYHEVLL
ncbi:hypothetical protein AQUCO_00400047v1 [Aquilegia coerulea]|uniref:ATP-dependent DNA helicase n=1 Tax=Aquilegia coerulea TaxID=218851 RepID=A0A2G5ET67_AQUCA|nr:hypothetical protein AQUCO_00400047v1 [Aquilegia coerulea]